LVFAVEVQGAALFALFAKGARGVEFALKNKNRLERRYGQRHLHFITCSCYQRRALLGTARKRDAFLKILDEVRTRYEFLLVGYVVMPEHIHLLISEPKIGTPSTVMQILKQRVSSAHPISNRSDGPMRRKSKEDNREKAKTHLCKNRKECGTPNFNCFRPKATTNSSPGLRVGHPPKDAPPAMEVVGWVVTKLL
jgi:REP element-mobilizing transposase RayT